MDHCSLLFLFALFSTFTSILSNNFLILLTNKNTLQRRHLSVFIKHFHIQWVNKVSHKLMFSLALVFLFWSCVVLVLVVDVGFWKQFKVSGTKSRYFSNIARKLRSSKMNNAWYQVFGTFSSKCIFHYVWIYATISQFSKWNDNGELEYLVHITWTERVCTLHEIVLYFLWIGFIENTRLSVEREKVAIDFRERDLGLVEWFDGRIHFIFWSTFVA